MTPVISPNASQHLAVHLNCDDFSEVQINVLIALSCSELLLFIVSSLGT